MSRLQNELLKRLRKMKDVLAYSINQTGFSYRGIPDVIIHIKGGYTIYAEIKEKGDRLSEIQKEVIKDLNNLGFKVYLVKSKDDIVELLKRIIEILQGGKQ